jgi:predicted RNA-binding Zn ribbon-like protein
MERPEKTAIEIDTTPPAPGDLELVRAFLSLHDHEPGSEADLAPRPATVRAWLEEAELLAPGEADDEADLRWACEVRDALRTMVLEDVGNGRDLRALALIDDATVAAGLTPRFGEEGLVPSAGGVKGAVGHILAVAFLARLDGSWSRFKICASPTCTAVFYDRSKNRSGKWCVMAECGNRAKVRAFRERERGHT